MSLEPELRMKGIVENVGQKVNPTWDSIYWVGESIGSIKLIKLVGGMILCMKEVDKNEHAGGELKVRVIK